MPPVLGAPVHGDESNAGQKPRTCSKSDRSHGAGANLFAHVGHAAVHALEGVGHWPQEEAPERVTELLDEFLPRAPGGQVKLQSA